MYLPWQLLVTIKICFFIIVDKWYGGRLVSWIYGERHKFHPCWSTFVSSNTARIDYITRSLFLNSLGGIIHVDCVLCKTKTWTKHEIQVYLSQLMHLARFFLSYFFLIPPESMTFSDVYIGDKKETLVKNSLVTTQLIFTVQRQQ